MQELIGHFSEATAFVVSDHPHTRTRTTHIRFWIESKRWYGQRFVSQVWNPDRGGRWKPPHVTRYAAVTVLYLGPSGHVEYAQLRQDVSAADLDAFVATYPVSCATAHNRAWLRRVRARTIARRRLAWRVRYDTKHRLRKSLKTQRVIFNRLVFEAWLQLDES